MFLPAFLCAWVCASQTPATAVKTPEFYSQSLRPKWLIGAARRWPDLPQPVPLPATSPGAPLLTLLQGPWGGGHTCGTFSPLQFVCSLGPPAPTAKVRTQLSLQHHEKHLLSLQVCKLWFAPVPSFSKARLRTEVTFRAIQPVRSDRCGHPCLPPPPCVCQLNRKLASPASHPHQTLSYSAPLVYPCHESLVSVEPLLTLQDFASCGGYRD